VDGPHCPRQFLSESCFCRWLTYRDIWVDRLKWPTVYISIQIIIESITHWIHISRLRNCRVHQYLSYYYVIIHFYYNHLYLYLYHIIFICKYLIVLIQNINNQRLFKESIMYAGIATCICVYTHANIMRNFISYTYGNSSII